MSEYSNFVEQEYDNILCDWQKYIVEINKVRESFGLPSRVFSDNEEKEFERQWVESRSV